MPLSLKIICGLFFLLLSCFIFWVRSYFILFSQFKRSWNEAFLYPTSIPLLANTSIIKSDFVKCWEQTSEKNNICQCDVSSRLIHWGFSFAWEELRRETLFHRFYFASRAITKGCTFVLYHDGFGNVFPTRDSRSNTKITTTCQTNENRNTKRLRETWQKLSEFKCVRNKEFLQN